MSVDLPSSLYTCAQVREIDKAAIDHSAGSGIRLMKRAGRAAFDLLLSQWPQVSRVVVLCGKGNNGGDGYVVAALTAQKRISVVVVSDLESTALTGDALRARQYADQEGVEVVSLKGFDTAQFDVPGTVVVDGVYGIGLRGDLPAQWASTFAYVNASPVPVLALDVPSGLSGDTGSAASDALCADTTITFLGVKRGLLTGRGPGLCGELFYDALDVPSQLLDHDPSIVRYCSPMTYPAVRSGDAHKGDFGHVMVVGGDYGYGGASMLAAEAAARSGAGMVSLATRDTHVTPSLVRLPEVMAVGVSSGQDLHDALLRPSVVVAGPGLGRSGWSEQMLQAVLAKDIPLVLDADALNLIAQDPAGYMAIASQMQRPCIITPHPGEAARLLGCTVAEVQSDRFAALEKLRHQYQCVVVLKGAGTLVADGSPNAPCKDVFLADVGNPGMAVAGMGDILAGLCGALLAQGLSGLDAALSAVALHGNAGDLAVANEGDLGLCAGDLVPYIRERLNFRSSD